jgi:hypothetical protein
MKNPFDDEEGQNLAEEQGVSVAIPPSTATCLVLTANPIPQANPYCATEHYSSQFPDQNPQLCNHDDGFVDSSMLKGLTISQMRDYLKDTIFLKTSGPVELVKLADSKTYMRSKAQTRITATQAHSFLGVLDSPMDTVMEKVKSFFHIEQSSLKQKSTRPQDKEACAYGVDNEEGAKKLYAKETGNTIEVTGLWVNSTCPWISGRPDGIVIDTKTGERGVLEVKCPFTSREKTIEQFCATCPFWKLTGKTPQLSRTHHYYTQVQIYMMVTGTDWCDFAVLVDKVITVERIPKDRGMVSYLCRRLAEFHGRFLLPTLTKRLKVPTEVDVVLLSKGCYAQELHELFTSCHN